MARSIANAGARQAFLAVLGLVLSLAPVGGRAQPVGVTWDDKVLVASGEAFEGPWHQNSSEFFYVDDPSIALIADGTAAVVWVDQTEHTVFLQVFEPGGATRFAGPVDVSRSPGVFSWLPRVVFGDGAANDVYVLWQEIVFSGGSHGGEIFFARSNDGGRSFADPINLTNSLAGDGKGRLTARRWHNGSLDLVMAPSGHLYAAWTTYEGELWFARSVDGGDSFSDPLLIVRGDDPGPARGPSLAAAADETIYLAWTVGEDDGADVHIATSLDAGQSFQAPRVAFDSDGHSDAPKIAVDDQGTIHLVYGESPDGRFEPYHIRYTRSTDGAETFEIPRDITSVHGEQFESVGFPSLSLTGANNLFIVWELFPGRRGYPQGLGLIASRDGGDTFETPSIVPGSDDPAFGTNGGRQGLLMRKLAVNGMGDIVVVNSTFKEGEASHIWLHRGEVN